MNERKRWFMHNNLMGTSRVDISFGIQQWIKTLYMIISVVIWRFIIKDVYMVWLVKIIQKVKRPTKCQERHFNISQNKYF